MKKHLFIIGLLLVLIGNNTIAQQTATIGGENSLKGLAIITETDFTETIFFTDPENQLFYIDLEATGEEISLLVIKQENKVVIEEDVTKLPENSIFEVNLKLLKQDTPYILELTTSFGVLTKEFSLKKKEGSGK